MATERRTPTRVRVKWPVVVITAKGVILAETRDISSEGAFILCEMPLSPKEKLRLFIMTPNQRPLEVSAEVAWSNPHSSEPDATTQGMGVHFTEVSAHHRQILRNIIAQFYKTKLSPTVNSG